MEQSANPPKSEADASTGRPDARQGLARVTLEDTPMPQALRAMRQAIEAPEADAPDSSNPRSGIVAMSEPLPSHRLQIDVDSLPPPPSLRPPSAPPPRLAERLAGRKVFRRVLDLIQDLLFTRSLAFAMELARSSWHSGYDSLHVLFRSIRLQKGEIAVDIGSGLGRVVAFLSRRFKGHMVIGIEADKTALFARRIFAGNPDIEIRYGDFVESYPDEATLFYIYPPTEGDFLRKLKGLIDERATKDTTVVARGALGGLGYFRQDPSWTVEAVKPPEGAFRRFVSTYFIYEHHKRGPGYHYGVILRKSISPRALPAPAAAPLPVNEKPPSEPVPSTDRGHRR